MASYFPSTSYFLHRVLVSLCPKNGFIRPFQNTTYNCSACPRPPQCYLLWHTSHIAFLFILFQQFPQLSIYTVKTIPGQLHHCMLGRNLQSLQYHCQWQQLVFQLELGYQHHGESHIYTCRTNNNKKTSKYLQNEFIEGWFVIKHRNSFIILCTVSYSYRTTYWSLIVPVEKKVVLC